jgi:hypothetical protein
MKKHTKTENIKDGGMKEGYFSMSRLRKRFYLHLTGKGNLFSHILPWLEPNGYSLHFFICILISFYLHLTLVSGLFLSAFLTGILYAF